MALREHRLGQDGCVDRQGAAVAHLLDDRAAAAQMRFRCDRVARQQPDDRGHLRRGRDDHLQAEVSQDRAVTLDARPRLLEAALHRVQSGERTQNRRSHAALFLRLAQNRAAALDRDGDARRPEQRHADQEVEDLPLRPRVAGAPRVGDCLVERLLGDRPLAAQPGNPGEAVPRLREQRVGVRLRQPVDHCADRRLRLVERELRLELQAHAPVDDRGVGLGALVAESAAGLDGLDQGGVGPGELACVAKRLAELGAGGRTARELSRSRQQRDRRRNVAGGVRASARCREPVGAALGELDAALVEQPELAAIDVRLLEVVADELVVAGFEELGDLGVQLGSETLR